MSLVNYSCLRNVSGDLITDIGWIVDHPDDPDYNLAGIGYATGVIITLIFLTGVPWNLFVIFTIVKKRLYSNPTIMLLLNLAITNFLLCILVMPLNIVTGFSGEYFFGNSDAVRCRVCQTGVLLILLPWVSVHTISLISVDRFIYLKRPLKYNVLITPKRMLIVITIVWIFCTVISLPPLFGLGEIKFSYTVASCVPYLVGRTHVAPNYIYVLFLAGVAILPITVLFTMYTCVIYIVRKSILAKFQRSVILNSSVAQEEGAMARIEKKKRSAELQLVKLFGAIFTANVITWLPMIVLALSGAIVGSGSTPTPLYTFAYLSFLLETVIHPLLEAYLIRDIKRVLTDSWTTLKKIVLCSTITSSITGTSELESTRRSETPKTSAASYQSESFN